MRRAALWLMVAAGLFGLACQPMPWLMRLLAANAGLAFLGLGLAYGFHWPRIFGKRGDGGLPAWSLVVFWPYYAANHTLLALYRRAGQEAPYHEIVPGLFLGCRLRPADEAALRPLGLCGVLDLAGEFSEVKFLRQVPAYRALPVLDLLTPSIPQLAEGAAFIQTHLAKGPVYVHCAIGHGRSATVVAAFLVTAKLQENWRGAVRFLQTKRPGVWLTPEQRACLEQIFPHALEPQ